MKLLSPIRSKENFSLSLITPWVCLNVITMASCFPYLIPKYSSSDFFASSIFLPESMLPNLCSVSLISMALSNCCESEASSICFCNFLANSFICCLLFRIDSKSEIFFTYSSCADLNSHGPSQFPI